MTANARRVGLPPVGAVRAREQLQGSPLGSGAEPLPPGQPGRATAASLGFTDPGSTLVFYVAGDGGGIADPNPQKAVVAAMAARAQIDKPAFLYLVGDVVYYNGDPLQYAPQFYEPFAHLRLPVVALPGNHDGDASDGVAGSGIATFMANFCTPSPQIPPGDPQLEFGRHTQTQPYCDWTLELEAVTIIGLYTNVPSGGVLAKSQTDWLTAELKAADPAKRLIVMLHHPPYSVDAHHGGSAKMGAALDAAFVAAQCWPELVGSGHVHDFQSFVRTVQYPVQHGKRLYEGPVRYAVCGNGGYHNLHALAPDAKPGLQVAPDVKFEYGDDSGWGFLKVTVTADGISGEYVGVAKDGTVTPAKYSF